MREEIARGVATLRSLLDDPDSPTVDIRRHLRLVNYNSAEIKALDVRIWEDIGDDEFEADLAVSYEFDAEVIEVRTHVEFARPSAALSRIAAKDPGAPSPDFAVIKHGKTTALSGGSKISAEADSVGKVHPECEPCLSELRVLTVGEESTRPGQIPDSVSDSVVDPLGAPSTPPCDDCVVFAKGQSTELTKDGVNTTHDLADPEPSLMYTEGPSVNSARGRARRPAR